MFCNNCGTKLDEDALFCPNCGNRVGGTAETPVAAERAVFVSEANTETVPGIQSEPASEVSSEAVSETASEFQSVANSETASEVSSETVSENESEVSSETIANSEAASEFQSVANREPASEFQNNMQGEKMGAQGVAPLGMTNPNMAAPGQFAQKKFCPNCGTENSMDDMFCQNCGMPFGNAETNMGGRTPQSAKKGVNAAKIAVPAVIAVVLIAMVCVFLPRILKGAGGSNDYRDHVLYIKDNELTMAKGSKFAPVMIGDKFYEDKDEASIFAYGQINYSSDYIYYPQDMETYGSAYDLYRKKLDDKKAQEEKIDSEVVDYEMIDNDTLAYIKDKYDRKLYIYKKNSSEKVASDVSWMDVSGNGKYIIWESSDSDNKLYVQDIAMKSDKIKLDSDISVVYGYSDDLKTIIYSKDDNLYILRNMTDKEKIASDIEDVYVYGVNGNLQIYYMKEGDDVKLSAYDLIDDDYLAQDKNMAQPNIKDYQTVTYVNDFFGTREKTETDDAYYAELEKYEEKLLRDDIRNALKNENLNDNNVEIYYYTAKSGESSKIMESMIFDAKNLGTDTALMYCANFDINKLEGGIKLSVIMGDSSQSYYDIEKEFMASIGECMDFVYIKEGNISSFAGLELNYSSEDNIDVVANDDTIYIKYNRYTEKAGEYHTELYSYNYNSKNPTAKLITDEMSLLVDSSSATPYYVNEDDELYYGEVKVDNDVYLYSVEVEDNGTILYMVDMDKDNQEGALKMYQGGKAVKIADDVAKYSYCIFDRNKVAFLSDYNFNKSRGDLKVYNGKTVIQVDSDVSCIFK